MKLAPKTLWPLGVVSVGALLSIGLVVAKPAPQPRTPERRIPSVRVVVAEKRPVQLRVSAQGTVVPRTESELVSEVSGRLIWVSPSLASGRFVEPGDVLARIDPADYEIAVERAEAALVRTSSERDLAIGHLSRVTQLRERGVSSFADLETAQSQEQVAHAARREAQAVLTQAHRELARTEILAPFAGRVREKHVDVGQFVSRGASVARVYAVDYAEVRLPISDIDANFLDLPVVYREPVANVEEPRVLLVSEFAGRKHVWHGRIVRTEGELDPRTRMINAVARVEDPYGRGEDPTRPPFAVGLFVDAEIEGQLFDDVIAIPRSALRGTNEVVIVDADGRLRLTQIDVLRRERHVVLIRGGIEAGDQICTSPLPIVVEGMQVRVVETEPAPNVAWPTPEKADGTPHIAKVAPAPASASLPSGTAP